MRKTALRVIHLGSTLLLSAVCCLAAGQVASPTPTATWPTNWPKGIAPSVVLDAQASPSTPVAEVETLYADLADSYGVISSIDSGLFATYQGKDRGGVAAWSVVFRNA